jgi:small subunit ribosomal protein S2
MTIKISLEELLETGAHFGHQVRRWNPKMAQYIYGEEEGVHIFDLVKTKEALESALKVLSDAARDGKKIVFVGTKKQVKEKVIEVAKEVGAFWVSERWLGGTLTNFDQIKRSLGKLKEMKEKKEAGEYKAFTKKERLLVDREIARLERFFGGLEGLEKTPDLMVLIDLKKERGAAKEAKKMGVETIGIIDTNSDPDLVDYPIPMNDDAVKALDYVLNLMKEAMKKPISKPKSEKKEK